MQVQNRLTEEENKAIGRALEKKMRDLLWKEVLGGDPMDYVSRSGIAGKFWDWSGELPSLYHQAAVEPEWCDLVTIAYRIPQSWPQKFQDACKAWFVDHSAKIKHRETVSGAKQWFYATSKIVVTRQSIEDDLLRKVSPSLNRAEAKELSYQIADALIYSKFEHELAEESERVRNLFRVTIVNINDVSDIDETSVVSESPDKAKMKAWAELNEGDKEVDDYDFFTEDLGRVRNPEK